MPLAALHISSKNVARRSENVRRIEEIPLRCAIERSGQRVVF